MNSLKHYNVDYIKESKYEYIALEIVVPQKSENVIVYPSQIVNVEDENILEALFDYNSSDMNLVNEYTINLHLIPKQLGKTNISIEFKDGDTNELIDIFNYSVKVDKELNVSFKEIK